ncbi:MAG: RQC domain-containing protein, partial [Mangrovibacterium sp.]|nr:RQC domain-containing protein [Mangrovibacterium sp.]
AEQEIGRQLLLDTASYAESAVCRRFILLNYFGEALDEPCGNCDNCLNPKEQVEAGDEVRRALLAIREVKEKYKAEHISDILTGKMTSAVKSFRHDELEAFGNGDDHSARFWNAVFRQGMVAGLITKDIENYGLLKLTDKGNAFIRRPESFLLVRNHNYDELEEEANLVGAPAGGAAGDTELFEMLKDLRKKVAKKLKLPPFVIFQDPSLSDMSVQYPVSIEELKNIQGVGEGKARRYGAEFVELIKAYVEDNDIERAQDMVVKSVANKSKMKVSIIHSIDRKISLEDIADSKGIDMRELVTEIEAIVNSGTRINLDYYIDEILDEDHQEEAYAYFREAEDDSVELALKELGEDEYAEEDIRLMRVKFISEMGN